jgi:hypothetical protein
MKNPALNNIFVIETQYSSNIFTPFMYESSFYVWENQWGMKSQANISTTYEIIFYIKYIMTFSVFEENILERY